MKWKNKTIFRSLGFISLHKHTPVVALAFFYVTKMFWVEVFIKTQQHKTQRNNKETQK